MATAELELVPRRSEDDAAVEGACGRGGGGVAGEERRKEGSSVQTR